MSVELKGMDSLLKKLDSLSHIEVKGAIQSVEDEAIKEIRKGASFAPKASQYVAKCDVRDSGHSYYVDVGLKNDNADFELWKEAYYHNYGYQDKGLNFGEKGPYISMHRQWFDSTTNTLSKKFKKEIKEKLEKEISKRVR